MKLLVLMLAVLAVAATKKRYDGYKLFHVTPDTTLGVDFLKQLGEEDQLDFWTESLRLNTLVTIFVPPQRLLSLGQELTQKNIPFVVATTDVQSELDAEDQRLSLRPRNAPYDYGDYNTFLAMELELETLRADCPADLNCDVYSIGLSYEGRALRVLRIWKDAGATPRRAYWLDSLIHPREWLSGATLMNIANKLIRERADPDSLALTEKYDWYILPVMNPDGYEYTWTDDRLWRKSRSPITGSLCIGTDLNRNYDWGWGGPGSSSSGCSSTYHGPSPASEPETQHVQTEAMRLAANLDSWVSFHCYGNYWLSAFGFGYANGSCAYPSNYDTEVLPVANAAADAVEATYNTDWLRGGACATLYAASGITVDFMNAVAGITYSFTPELRGVNFTPVKEQIPFSVNEVWNGLLAMIGAIEARA